MERYREYKDSGVEWIGQIPTGWEVVPLKSLFTFGKGLQITKADLGESGLPVISYGQIHSKDNSGTRITDSLIRWLPDKSGLVSESSLTHCGDFIFADTSEDTDGCGNCVLVDTNGVYAGYHTIIAHAKESRWSRYLAYLFTTDCWRSQIRSRVVGVKLYSITRRILDPSSVLMPSVSECNAIADFLDSRIEAIDSAIADAGRSIELLEEYRKSIISEAVTKGLNSNALMKDSGIEWIGRIPARWQVVNPNGVFAQRKERAREGDEMLTASQKYGMIPQSKYDQTENYKTVKVITGSDILKHVEPGDFVISMRSFQGGIEYSPYRGKMSSAYVALYPRNDWRIADGYYKYLFKSFRYILSLQRTSNLVRDGQALRYANFSMVPLPYPPEDEQLAIANHLDNVTRRIDSLVEQKQILVEKLGEYRKSLIYEAVTGKFKVPDVKEGA